MEIENALHDVTAVNFVHDIPLKDALAYLRELHSHRNLVRDAKALSDEGISFDNTVNLTVTGVSLRSALSMMLEPLLLDHIIQNETMVITTQRSKADATSSRPAFTTPADFQIPSLKRIGRDHHHIGRT